MMVNNSLERMLNNSPPEWSYSPHTFHCLALQRGLRSLNMSPPLPHAGYDGLNETSDAQQWGDIHEKFDGDRLDIDGHPVMQKWEVRLRESSPQVYGEHLHYPSGYVNGLWSIP